MIGNFCASRLPEDLRTRGIAARAQTLAYEHEAFSSYSEGPLSAKVRFEKVKTLSAVAS